MTLYVGNQKVNIVLKAGLPTGTIEITENGTVDVTDYASANVNVSGGGSVRAIVNGVYKIPETGDNFEFKLPNEAKNISDYALYQIFSVMPYTQSPCTGITSVDLSSLTTISGMRALFQAFSSCTGITSVDLSNLTTISGNYTCQEAFSNCTGITSVDLSSLTTISSQAGARGMFLGCTGITSVDLSSLTTISGNNGARFLFQNTSLSSIKLNSLALLSGGYALYGAFSNTLLTSLSFPSLNSNSFGNYTTQFGSMLSGVSGCTVHFPSNLQSVIGSWNDVINGFGGTNTTVLWDLPATS